MYACKNTCTYSKPYPAYIYSDHSSYPFPSIVRHLLLVLVMSPTPPLTWDISPVLQPTGWKNRLKCWPLGQGNTGNIKYIRQCFLKKNKIKNFIVYFCQFECQIHLTEFNCKLLYHTLSYYVITDLTAFLISIELKFMVINIFSHHIK